MTKSKLAYKQDTGFDATFNIESDIYTPDDDDCAPSVYCCRVDDFTNEYVIDRHIIYVPDPAYVRWLEEKVEGLLKLNP